MEDKFYIGLALGMLGGALIVTNSIKARQLVKEGQDTVVDKIDEWKTSAKPKKPAKSGK